MVRKKHSPEQIVALLRQIEVAISSGKLGFRKAKFHLIM